MNQLYQVCLISRWSLVKVTQYKGLLEQWVKQFLFLLAFMLVGTNAISQTTFSFAGLTWGDSIQIADNKLKASGFLGCAVSDKLSCSLNSSCNCRYTGGGPAISYVWIFLLNNRLESIDVGVHTQEWSNTINQLERKYGKPLVCPAITKGKLAMDYLCWKSSNGETIDTNSDLTVIYKSGERNKKENLQDRANRSVF